MSLRRAARHDGQGNSGHSPGTGPSQPRVPTDPSHPPTDRASVVSPRLLSIAQAARYLSVSTWTVREMIWRGDLPHVRCGRRILLDLRDLDTWIEREKVRGV